MDSVRFGRALGVGTRAAARALAGAAEAAAAPNPVASGPVASRPSQPGLVEPSRPVIQTAARAAAHATVKTRNTKANLARGGRRFGEAIWGPLAKLSGVLWLEMTGAFFAIFALFAAQGLWHARADLRSNAANHAAHQHALVYAGMAVLFTYFTVTSFLRARRRSR